mgnify:CR=1 FL=1
MIKDAGIDVRTAVRKREPLYAELNLADAGDDELLDAMAEHPILIERPFVVTTKRHPAGPADRRRSRDSVTRRALCGELSRCWSSSPLRAAALKTADYHWSLVDVDRDAQHPPPPRRPVPIAEYLEGRRRHRRARRARQAHRSDGHDAAAEGLGAVQQSELRAGHAGDRQGRHLPHRNVGGVPSSARRLRRQRGHQARLRRRGTVAELQAAQRLHRRLARLSIVDDRGQLRPQRPPACTATTASSSPPAAPPANQRYLVQFTVDRVRRKRPPKRRPTSRRSSAGFNVACRARQYRAAATRLSCHD